MTTLATAPSAQRVGSDLRAARERLGWSLDAVSGYVRIRVPLLQALEDGRVGDLPGPVYAVGFVRTYAQALGVDAAEMVRRFQAEVGPAALPRAELDFPRPVAQGGVPPGAVVMLGAVLAVVGYAGWYRSSGEHAGLAPVQQIPAHLAPLALPVVPPPPRLHVQAAEIAPAGLAAVYVPPSVPPSAAEAGVPAPGSLRPIEPAPVAAVAGGGATHVVLGATADAWVQVKDAAGKIVLSKVLHAGETWPVPDQASGSAPLTLTTGNAGGTVLTLDGQAMAPLGAAGAVRRDVALDPAGLRAPG